MQSLNVTPGVPSKFKGLVPYAEQSVEVQPNKFITGITRDSSGTALPSCRVALFQTNGDVFMGATTSDGTGSYTFYSTPGAYYYTVAYLAGSPDVFGTTVNTLGGEIATPAAPVVITDAFTRADGGLGANWTTDTNLNHALTIVSNTCKGSTAAAHNVAVYSASGIIQANQYAQFTVTTTGGFIGPVLRSDGAGTFYTCYYSTSNLTIYKWTAGSSAQIGTGSTVTPTVGDVVYFEAVGSALTMKVNGVTKCTATDSAITGAGYAGIDIYDTTAAVDDFQAGTA